MRVYAVYCHPDPSSFTSVVRQRAVDTLRTAGHEVRSSDLYADGFEPTMSATEVSEYLDARPPSPEISSYCDSLTWCEALVLVYPTWWSGQPAMLTGWLDRVLVRGVAWELSESGSRVTGRLGNVRRLVTITTHGSPRYINLLEGETGRRVIGRALRVLCHSRARTIWLSLYNIDRATAEQRHAFLDRVERRLQRL